MVRFQIRLEETSFRILQDLAEREYRDPRFQASLLIREALERRGLLLPQDKAPTQDQAYNKQEENGTE